MIALGKGLVAGFGVFALLGSCDEVASQPAPSDVSKESEAGPVQASRTITVPAPQPPEVPAQAEFVFDGVQTQGGWLRGTAPHGTVRVTLDEAPVPMTYGRQFFLGLDRDAGEGATLTAHLANGESLTSDLRIAPRAWNIEHVNVAKRSGGNSEAWWKKREPEWLAIKAAREKVTGATGWRQQFIWPVRGRISGRFGSQRIYRGEPGSYHSGLDIAPGAGMPFVAPADGVVVLAARNFSLEGNLLIIDHGHGLNSAFLHASRLTVNEGDRVQQGQHIGDVGSSGRATGPHLHWSIKWNDARLDPLLFVDPRA